MKTVETVFSEWAREGRGERMAEGHWPRTKQIIARMGIEPGMACLDVGCGNGYAVRAMANEAGPEGSVFGVDFSADMIEAARKHPDNPNTVRFERAAAEKLPIDANSIDRLLSVEMLYYATDIPVVLAEWFRVLRPGGSLWVMMDYYRENRYCHTWKEDLGVSSMTLLSENDYKAQLEALGFKNVQLSRIFDPRPVDLAGFTPGWGYGKPEDVTDFRTRVGSLLVSAMK